MSLTLPVADVFPAETAPPLRWGIVGTGIAASFVEGLRLHTGQIPTAVTSFREARARAFSQTYDVPHVSASVSQLVQRTDVDVIYVASPNALHREHALQAIDAGKHVLIEKPIGLNADEATEILNAARRAGVLAMEGLWTRYLPQSSLIRKVLSAGIIGEVHFVETHFGFIAPTEESNRLWDPVGGGALFDAGVYCLSFIEEVLGATAALQFVQGASRRGVDSRAMLALSSFSGASGLVATSLVSSMPAVATIMGSKGRLTVKPPFFGPSSVEVIAGRFGEERIGQWSDQRFDQIHHGLSDEANAFARFVAAGHVESPLHPHDETIAAMRILDEAREHILGRSALPD